jgi:hypothetical protein
MLNPHCQKYRIRGHFSRSGVLQNRSLGKGQCYTTLPYCLTKSSHTAITLDEVAQNIENMVTEKRLTKEKP